MKPDFAKIYRRGQAVCPGCPGRDGDSRPEPQAGHMENKRTAPGNGPVEIFANRVKELVTIYLSNTICISFYGDILPLVL